MRHQTHLIEEESFFELRKILPKEWVFREKPKDYGIDVEIEIFNSKGDYTGLVFWIQLKGTASLRTKDHRSIRMPIDKINQLASYELPVALFRYNSKNREFYFEWFVRYRFLSSSSRNKTFDIKFEDHHLWSSTSINQIITYLQKRERISAEKFSFPIRGFVNEIEVSPSIARKLSSEISKNSSLVKITRERNLADIEINLLTDRIVLNFSGAFGSSIGFGKENINKVGFIYSAFKEALLLILNQINKDAVLLKYIKENDLLGDILKHPPILRYMLPRLLQADVEGQFSEQIIESVFKNDDQITQTLIQSIVFLLSENISQERIEKYYKLVIKIFCDKKDFNSLTTCYYSFGNHYRGIGDLKKAIEYYNKARKIDPTYLKRGYFCRELGGILFELSFYALSAKFYSKARKLEEDNIYLIGTQADAEMYSGNYEKALNLFNEFLIKNRDAQHDKYEFSLKYIVLRDIVQTFEIKVQNRKTSLLPQKIKSLSKEQLEDEDVLYELLKIDALSSFTWSQFSAVAYKNEDFMLHLLSSLMRAVVVKRDPYTWAYLTILTTFDKEVMKSIHDIANTAYFYCGEQYFSILEEFLDLGKNEDLKEKDFVGYVESLVRDPKEYSKEIRFWEGEDVRIFKF